MNKGERFRAEQNIRQLTLREYTEWLKGYCDSGGGVYTSNYPMRDIFKVCSSIVLPRLEDADAFNFIVAKGCTVTTNEYHHCTIFYWDGFKAFGDFPTIYSDIPLDFFIGRKLNLI